MLGVEVTLGKMVDPRAPSLGNEAVKLSVVAESTNILFRRRTKALLSHYVVALLPLTVGSTEVAWRINLALIGLLLTYTTLNLLGARWYNAQAPSEALARKGRRSLYVQLFALGLLYNLIFLHLAICEVPNAMDYLLMLSVAFCAGGAVSYQHLRWLAVVFIVSAMTPQAIYYVMTGERGGALMSFLILVFMLFMSNACEELYTDAVQRLELTRALTREKAKAESLARTGPLTELLNRRAFMELGRTNMQRALRYHRQLAVVMLDVDHFKSTNDRHGHGAGDQVLVAVAETIREVVRSADVAARIGGEEFALLLPDTDAEGALALAERLRTAICEKKVSYERRDIAVTASLGVAARIETDEALDTLIRRADAALYQAKEEGRNRTIASTPPEAESDSSHATG